MKYKSALYCFILTILCIIILYFFIRYFLMDNVSPFISNYDGKNYAVRNIGNNNVKQTAADYLSVISGKIDKIVNYMHDNNLPDPDTANRLYSRWSKIELKETNSSEKSAAYTLNKSSEIRLCIRSNDGNFEDPNTSMFVILHELAHVASISFGHNDEFKNNFSYITHLASSLGLYEPEDFKNRPKTYCNVEINTTPCDNGSCVFNNLQKE